MSERGFALLIVLWTLVLVTLVGTQLTASGRGEAQRARNLVDAATAEAAADGAVFEAVSRLVDPAPTRHWEADGEIRTVRLVDGIASVRIEDDSGKIDPNIASANLLAAMLRVLGADGRAATTMSLAIVQWRFPGGQGGTPEDEARAYRAARRGYAPPESPFQTIDELGLVLGMTPDLLARLRPHLTIYAQGDPDPRRADPMVTEALRLQAGRAVLPATDDRAGRVVSIVADIDGPNGSRAERRATVRVGAAADARGFRILGWN